MLERQLRLPVDLVLGIPETRPSISDTDYAYQLEKQFIRIRDTAKSNNCVVMALKGSMTEGHTF